MAFVLAIEPDPQQVETIQGRLGHDLAGHELLVVASSQEALEAIERRVPDLVLVHAFFSPGDERTLMARLREVGAAPPPTLAIPFFESTSATEASAERRWFYWLKRSKATSRTDADGARLFAEQLKSYLEDCKGIDAAPVALDAGMLSADVASATTVTEATPSSSLPAPDSEPFSALSAAPHLDVPVMHVPGVQADSTTAEMEVAPKAAEVRPHSDSERPAAVPAAVAESSHTTGRDDPWPRESFDALAMESESVDSASTLIVRHLASVEAPAAGAEDRQTSAFERKTSQARDASGRASIDPTWTAQDQVAVAPASFRQEDRPRASRTGSRAVRASLGGWWKAGGALGGRARAAAAILVLAMMGSVRWTIAPPRIDLARAAPPENRQQPVERPKPVTRRTGQLEVSSDPSGATVVVDGRTYGETPLTIDALATGAHTVTLERGGSIIRRAVTIRPARTASVHAAIYPGWLAVFAPFELEVLDDGRALNLDEQEQAMVPAGRHEIRLVNRDLGYREDRVVEIEPGKLTVASVELPQSQITVVSTPPAEVWIDGARAGETPLVDVPVGIGSREIILRNAAFRDRHVTVTVTMAPARVDVDLTKP